MKKTLTLISGLLMLLYPLLVYFSLGQVSISTLALGLILLAIIRGFSARHTPGMPLQVSILLVLAGILYIQGNIAWLRYHPVLINLAMLAVFAYSLWRGPSVIERLARLSEPDLPASGVAYTRKVTQVWCGFFILNGSIALWTACYASWDYWTLYNGGIAYVLMGALMAGEWILRQRIRTKQ
ncbi:COG4648 family protein [Deefgea piscis]|uniref:COG4648 family protein n=1 Tax=Deefgea piscis TaxID=2739061 RepID=UPI001C8225E7|nr:hypothetical protein [Deefgea piscis]QZA82541.1 hypothetical protein K4H25_07895 [Deefgea piscis]